MVTWMNRALATLVCAWAAIPALAAERTFDRHFTVTPGRQFTLNTDVGSISLVGSQAATSSFMSI